MTTKQNSTISELIKINRKNKIFIEKINVIDKLLTLYPNLQKDEIYILNSIFASDLNKHILKKININDEKYYIDTIGNILNKNVSLVGFWIKEEDESMKIILFDDTKNKIKIMKKKLKFCFNN
jgi:hypothetical protein